MKWCNAANDNWILVILAIKWLNLSLVHTICVFVQNIFRAHVAIHFRARYEINLYVLYILYVWIVKWNSAMLLIQIQYSTLKLQT